MIDQHNSLAEKFLKKGFWLYLFSFIIAPIGYIIKIIISGELTVSEVGILYGIISLITMISAYNDLGMSESLKHFIPQFVNEKSYDKVKSILFLALGMQIMTSLVIACFFYFGADFIAMNYFKTDVAKEIIQVFAFFIIGLNIFQTLSHFFLSIQDTLTNKGIDFLRMIFIMSSILFVFIGDYGTLINYSYSWLIGLYIGIIIAIIVFFKKYYYRYLNTSEFIFNKQFIKPILRYASVVVLGSSAATLLSQIDMQMIIYLLGTESAGYYTNYLSIIGIPFILIGPIFAFLFPVFSEMHGKGEHSKIQTVKNIFSKNFILIGIMFNLFFFIFAKNISYTLFGEKFIESGNILQYSILFLIFNFLLQINFHILSGIGQVGKRVKIIFSALIFNIIGNLILINIIGVYGAALSTGFGWILIFILSEYHLGNKYKIHFDFKNILKNIVFMGICSYIATLYILPLGTDLSRIETFLFLGANFIGWSFVFLSINIKTIQILLGEIKKLKRRN